MTTPKLPEAVEKQFRDTKVYTSTVEGLAAVLDAETYEETSETLREIAGRIRALETERLKITRPMDQAKRSVMDLFKAPIDRLTRARRHLEQIRGVWRAEQRRKEIEAQRRADAEAERERQKLTRRAEKAADGGKPEKAAELQAQAAAVVPPVLTATVPKSAGVSVRQVAKFEVVDPEKLPRTYLVPDMTKIGKVVRAMRTDTDIPGVRVWLEDQEAVRA